MMRGRGGRARGRPAPRRKSNAPKSDIGKMLQDYLQASVSLDFNALVSGGDLRVTLIDNDARYSNSVLNWSKLTIRPIWDADDVSQGTLKMKTLYMLVYKQDQDDSTVHSLDSEEAIRELRNTKRILRGPWMVTSPERVTEGFMPPMTAHMKPIVLRNFVLDREEDLHIGFTLVNSAFPSTSEVLTFFMKGYVRVIK